MTATVEAPVEVQPGVYDNVDAEIYHADPVPGGSLSSTGARKLATECPAATAIGRHLNEVALNTYALCRESGEWPGYLQTPLISPPAWLERQYR